MGDHVLQRLARRFGDTIIDSGLGKDHAWVVVDRAVLHDVAMFLRDTPELRFDMPIDCTAIDWLGVREPRFEVVYHLYSMSHGHRLRLKAQVPESDPNVSSLSSVWRGMNWHERETWDMYGIRFAGHPDLRRVLMYEEFQGHPLRKDFPVDGRQPLIEMRPVRDVRTQRDPTPDMLNKP